MKTLFVLPFFSPFVFVFFNLLVVGSAFAILGDYPGQCEAAGLGGIMSLRAHRSTLTPTALFQGQQNISLVLLRIYFFNMFILYLNLICLLFFSAQLPSASTSSR